MRIATFLILVVLFAALSGALLYAQGSELVTAQKTLTSQPSSPFDRLVLAGLVCFSSALTYAIFGMPKAGRFKRIMGDFLPPAKYKRARRASEILCIAIIGGTVGYFLLTPTNGAAALSAGAMWYGALYRISSDDSETT